MKQHPHRFPARPALSIRWRLTLWYLLILTLVLVTFGGVVYATQSNSIRSSLNSDLAHQANDLAASYDPSSGQFDIDGTSKSGSAPNSAPTQTPTPDEKTLETLKKTGQLGATLIDGGSAQLPGPRNVVANVSPSLLALGVGGVALLVDPGGKILTHFGRLSDADVTALIGQAAVAGAPRAGTNAFTESLHTLVVPSKAVPYRFVTTPLLVKNSILGTLIVGVPDKAPAQLHRLLVTLLIATPITLVIAAAGGYWLAARAMRPVRAITETARSIGATDLSRRLNLPNRDELGALAATFDQMLERLEATFHRQRQFTSDASHELRTPLTIVQLELEHVRAGAPPAPEVIRALDAIQSENEYMSRLVNDLLTLARADAGRAALGHERVDLSDLTLEAVERLAPLAREKGIGLTVGDLPRLDLSGDAPYLTRMLVNVIENAIRYTAEVGHVVRIDAGECRIDGGRQGWVRVCDDGPGIAAEHLPHLFERFYRVDQTRERRGAGGGPGLDGPSGSGLGLSIVQWVARSHGGDVRVESVPGRGSTFEIRLPLAPSDSFKPAPASMPESTNERP